MRSTEPPVSACSASGTLCAPIATWPARSSVSSRIRPIAGSSSTTEDRRHQGGTEEGAALSASRIRPRGATTPVPGVAVRRLVRVSGSETRRAQCPTEHPTVPPADASGRERGGFLALTIGGQLPIPIGTEVRDANPGQHQRHGCVRAGAGPRLGARRRAAAAAGASRPVARVPWRPAVARAHGNAPPDATRTRGAPFTGGCWTARTPRRTWWTSSRDACWRAPTCSRGAARRIGAGRASCRRRPA